MARLLWLAALALAFASASASPANDKIEPAHGWKPSLPTWEAPEPRDGRERGRKIPPYEKEYNPVSMEDCEAYHQHQYGGTILGTARHRDEFCAEWKRQYNEFLSKQALEAKAAVTVPKVVAQPAQPVKQAALSFRTARMGKYFHGARQNFRGVRQNLSRVGSSWAQHEAPALLKWERAMMREGAI
ncbi:MAG: hypothetical protein M1826_001083 [Phylliscum demangeonii]|nr:MAG: hypothetical protein M1826_001083 [Phylliscum demangeonii]